MKRASTAILAFLVSAFALPNVSLALTLKEALANAYRNNPDINQQRAATRVIDEQVPSALSGYRPSLSASATASPYISQSNNFVGTSYTTQQGSRTGSVTLSQPVFDGYKTKNGVNSAESNVKLAREDLKSKEQTIFLAIIVAYLNVIRDEAIVKLRTQAVDVANRDLRTLNDRFKLGDASRTDVGLTEANQGLAKQNLALAKTNLAISRSVFIQNVGLKADKLQNITDISKLLPRNMQNAIESGVSNHPSVKAAQYGADAAQYGVYVAQSALYPSLSLSATGSHGNENATTIARSNTGSIGASLIVPIFANGGRDYSTIRAAKETLGQRQIQIDLARANVKQIVMQMWGSIEQARLNKEAVAIEIKGRETVVKGFREEYKVGQKILQNVLVEEVNLTNARVSSVQIQNNYIVSSYSLLAAMGKLSAETLGLNVDKYDPSTHYDAVRDNWTGLRTPDGR